MNDPDEIIFQNLHITVLRNGKAVSETEQFLSLLQPRVSKFSIIGSPSFCLCFYYFSKSDSDCPAKTFRELVGKALLEQMRCLINQYGIS